MTSVHFDMTVGLELVLSGIALYYGIMFTWAYRKTRNNMQGKNK